MLERKSRLVFLVRLLALRTVYFPERVHRPLFISRGYHENVVFDRLQCFGWLAAVVLLFSSNAPEKVRLVVFLPATAELSVNARFDDFSPSGDRFPNFRWFSCPCSVCVALLLN